MPIYEYRCEECQQVFEEWCKHVEDADVHHPCPICKGDAHRLISNTSFALKGGGWYVTEYGSRKNQSVDSSSASSSSGSCSTGTGTSSAAGGSSSTTSSTSAGTAGS